MENKRINGYDLIELGFPENISLGIALQINKQRLGFSREEMLAKYKAVLENPAEFMTDNIFKPLAEFLQNMAAQSEELIALKDSNDAYVVFGEEHIEQGARDQMNTAMRLPVAVAGALMPDAHQGYGLPIGGVLATRNAVIPYGVGVDIGCRMALSIFDIPESYLLTHHDVLKQILMDNTKFGAGHGFLKNERSNHSVLDHAAFTENTFVSTLKDKAWTQLGSSGGGNHFVEFGIMEFDQGDADLAIEKGRYLALLTHSGSRGLGATIADHYTKVAMDNCKLPYMARHLAYLDLDSQAGQEYWLAMNLAGDYASACHEIIHEKIRKAVGAELLAKIENHHNFAWKEKWNNQEVIVHRKGATPASKGTLGIIPGSMATPGFLVRGKGEEASINSASHGAGRLMSRTKAVKTLNKYDLKAMLSDHGVTLLGAGMDEAPMAYKDIHTVMEAQRDLVDTIATFHPKIVRMADDGSKED
ncbi:RtcB family protein [Sphingobacterium sp. DK4209]|uniref:3'-phosphate/5'-hydroxy nucleic acid ligase n=1 Tax=Sphingobacterium zhuxiongii TaxID=2662364 RepID=A0A5Q0QI07_9SPHI|nr:MULTISPECIES: RtcB family protein [unclassified Sphingobacterium]MVZ66518.1 RtcB family protein [Sphingobacterium sp. DK4209]QGA27828.1 RtcB family protein [Sphingobacterium sp. dk4302]